MISSYGGGQKAANGVASHHHLLANNLQDKVTQEIRPYVLAVCCHCLFTPSVARIRRCKDSVAGVSQLLDVATPVLPKGPKAMHEQQSWGIGSVRASFTGASCHVVCEHPSPPPVARLQPGRGVLPSTGLRQLPVEVRSDSTLGCSLADRLRRWRRVEGGQNSREGTLPAALHHLRALYGCPVHAAAREGAQHQRMGKHSPEGAPWAAWALHRLDCAVKGAPHIILRVPQVFLEGREGCSLALGYCHCRLMDPLVIVQRPLVRQQCLLHHGGGLPHRLLRQRGATAPQGHGGGRALLAGGKGRQPGARQRLQSCAHLGGKLPEVLLVGLGVEE
mmetsp:Transcript_28751/g.80960  ORF Transcript_28751/g.80960 Transcript_28751/m.80960 type:complete len:333 (+) Transcript_28751:998-1996(+)